MKNIKFVIYTDLYEAAAAFAARQIAEKIRKENYGVTIVKFPREMTAQKILAKYTKGMISEKECVELYQQSVDIHDSIMEDSCHVIDFHNSPLKTFSLTENTFQKMMQKGGLPRIEIIFPSIPHNTCFPLFIDDKYATNGKLVAILELPAIYQKLLPVEQKIGGKIKKLLKWLNKNRIVSDFGFSLLSIDRFRLANIQNNRDAGILSEKLFQHISSELLRLIREEEEYVRNFPKSGEKKHRLLTPLFLQEKRVHAQQQRNRICRILNLKEETKERKIVDLIKSEVPRLKRELKVLKEVIRQNRIKDNLAKEKKTIKKNNEIVRKIYELEDWILEVSHR